MYFSQGDGKVNTPNEREGDELLPKKQVAQQGLAIPPTGERTCDDATDPAQSDINRLCRIWAEVGRAILVRRQQFHEQENPK